MSYTSFSYPIKTAILKHRYTIEYVKDQTAKYKKKLDTVYEI